MKNHHQEYRKFPSRSRIDAALDKMRMTPEALGSRFRKVPEVGRFGCPGSGLVRRTTCWDPKVIGSVGETTPIHPLKFSIDPDKWWLEDDPFLWGR